jgi:CHASE3 domain sensor protein
MTLNDRYIDSTRKETDQLTEHLATPRNLMTIDPNQLRDLERVEAEMVQLRAFAAEVMATRRSQRLQAAVALIATDNGEIEA